MARVETQVAIALGASVHPLTMMTPNVNTVVMINAGYMLNSEMKSNNVISIE